MVICRFACEHKYLYNSANTGNFPLCWFRAGTFVIYYTHRHHALRIVVFEHMDRICDEQRLYQLFTKPFKSSKLFKPSEQMIYQMKANILSYQIV